jgi:hypothetical protein
MNWPLRGGCRELRCKQEEGEVPKRRLRMKETRLTLLEVSLIAGTRAALGGGLALLFADRLSQRQRKTAGWALFLTGVVSTIPLGKLVLDSRR